MKSKKEIQARLTELKEVFNECHNHSTDATLHQTRRGLEDILAEEALVEIRFCEWVLDIEPDQKFKANEF